MRGHNNVQGASDFGCLKNMYPGYEKVSDDKVRAKWAKAWGVAPDKLSGEIGEDNFLMVEHARKKKVRAMYVIGEETAFSDADTSNVHEAFTDLDFFVVQDIFLSRTAEFADVVLPGCPSVEKDGTFVNTERRIQRFHQVMPPLGNSRPDWRILTDLAARMGHDWGYAHPCEIMDEVAGIADIFAGVSYERLEGWKSLCWPVAADGTDTPLLYTDGFHTDDGKAVLHPLEWQRSGRRAGFRLRPDARQRAHARALPGDEPDRAQPRHPGPVAGLVRRGQSRTGRGARHRGRLLGAPDFAAGLDRGARGGDRPGARQRPVSCRCTRASPASTS